LEELKMKKEYRVYTNIGDFDCIGYKETMEKIKKLKADGITVYCFNTIKLNKDRLKKEFIELMHRLPNGEYKL
jgi:hypothetical protein